MGSLINALLSYTRLSHEHALFETADLNAILRHVLEDLELLIQDTDASFQIGDLPLIEAIPLQMHQLLQNLISNSLKYAATSRKPLVSVQASLINGQAELTVSDNGKGFSIKDKSQVFRLFERIDPEGEGMGIGLALCKKIVDTHRGSINAESTPGTGSVFTINLPIKQNKSELETG
jgi:signal transduction histidine kinase